MKKKIWMTVGAVLVAGSVFAYNPPAGGQNVQRVSSPFLLTGANSTAGTSLSEVTPASVVNNPALTAFEQRIVIDVGGTFFMDDNDVPGSDAFSDLGGAFQAGILFPSRWCVTSFLVQGVFAPLVDMHLGKNVGFTAGVSKDINDKVSVGIALNGGGFWNDGSSDWTLAANTGVYYHFGSLAFMKNLRFAVTLMNLGKMYTDAEVLGIQGDVAKAWPALATPRAGVAATVLDTGDFSIGGSVDVSSPAFQDFVLDLGVALQYSGLSFATFKLASAWEYDLRECAEKSRNIIPSVGLSVKFNFSSKEDSKLAQHGWQESEITAGGAWRNLYEDVNAYSVGVVLKLGMEDKEPPVITLWGED